MNEFCTHNEQEVPNLKEQRNASQAVSDLNPQTQIENPGEIQDIDYANADESINGTSHPDISTRQHEHPPTYVPLQNVIYISTIKALSKNVFFL